MNSASFDADAALSARMDADAALLSPPSSSRGPAGPAPRKPRVRGYERVRATSMLEWNEVQDIQQFEHDIDELSGSENSRGGEGEPDEDDFLFLELDGEPRAGPPNRRASLDCVAAGPLQAPPSKEDEAPNTGSTMRRSVSAVVLPSFEESRPLASTIMPTFMPTIDETHTKLHTTPPGKENSKHVTKVDGLVLVSSPPRSSKDSQTSDNNSSGSVASEFSSSMPSRVASRSSLKSMDGNASLTRNVSFSSLEIRNYAVTMGDTPTTNGCPIQLDWDYDPEAEEYTVEGFEEYRLVDEPRRARSEMIIPASHREYLLLQQAGFTSKEIKAQMAIVAKDALRRRKTCQNLNHARLDYAIEKTKRKLGKLKRSPSLKGSGDKGLGDWLDGSFRGPKLSDARKNGKSNDWMDSLRNGTGAAAFGDE